MGRKKPGRLFNEDTLHRTMIERIERLAKAQGVRLSDLPPNCDIGSTHFWDIMAGRVSPRLIEVDSLASVLGVSVSELLDLKKIAPH